jgi:hypothetical protein
MRRCRGRGARGAAAARAPRSQAAAWAISSGSAARCGGVFALSRSRRPGDRACRVRIISVSVLPGAMTLTRTPSGPYGTAADSVRLSPGGAAPATAVLRGVVQGRRRLGPETRFYERSGPTLTSGCDRGPAPAGCPAVVPGPHCVLHVIPVFPRGQQPAYARTVSVRSDLPAPGPVRRLPCLDGWTWHTPRPAVSSAPR